MDRRFRKAAVIRILLGLLTIWPVVTLRDLALTNWPRLERPVEIAASLALAVLLYFVTIAPILGYVDRSTERSDKS
jgi:hypothetical protein